MRINAISFVYAARFVLSPKKVGLDHIKGILFEPLKSGLVRLVATDGHCLIVVHDGAVHVDDETRQAWIDPSAPGLLSAAKKGEFVTVRADGIVEVEKAGAVIYVSPVSCERKDKAAEFPPHEQVIGTELKPKARNYSLNTKYLDKFDLGNGVTVYPAGDNLDPLIVQPSLLMLGGEIESAIGVLMPMNQKLESGYTLSKEHIWTFINRE
jgi:hypothetical protein